MCNYRDHFTLNCEINIKTKALSLYYSNCQKNFIKPGKVASSIHKSDRPVFAISPVLNLADRLSLIVMEFDVGENIEAVDEFGVWANATVVEKRGASVVVTFPPWKSEWDREIIDASETRKVTEEQVLVPRRFTTAKVKR